MLRVITLGYFVCLFITLGYVLSIEDVDALKFSFSLSSDFIFYWLIVENGTFAVGFFGASVSSIAAFVTVSEDDGVGIFPL